jgi:sarcosine oxidase
MSKRIAVVGGGIAGLCTAVALVKRGVKPVVLERRRIGGSHGSSHGPSRITRSVYADAAYVRIMQRLHREHWPALEAMLGEPLLFKTDGLFFGHGALWEKYLAAVLSQQIDVEHVDVSEGRRRFPQFKFSSATSVMHDHTSAVIAADRTLRGLHRWLLEQGVDVREDTSMLQGKKESTGISLQIGRGSRATLDGWEEFDAAVICMGAWHGDSAMPLETDLTVLRQTIGYFDFGDAFDGRPPNFPVWVAIGATEEDVFYGLPEFDVRGVKIARHRTVGESESADAVDYRTQALEDIDEFIAREFVAPPRARLAIERCLYSVTRDQDFILGTFWEEPRVIYGSACSGHGFKFAPWVGEVLADLALNEDCQDPDFIAERERFSPLRYRAIPRPFYS